MQSPSNFKILPPVVKNLLIINGLAFLALITFESMGTDLNQLLGLHYWGADKFRPYQFITYMFMHGNFAHILFNMFALWMFGKELEHIWGPKRFLIYYLITGIGAALIHYTVVYFEIQPTLEAINIFLSNPNHEVLHEFLKSDNFQLVREIQFDYTAFAQHYNSIIESQPSEALRLSVDFMTKYKSAFLNAPVVVGASGAVFGILLAFGMMFPNVMLYLYFAIPVKAKYFVIGYGILELISGFYSSDNVAHFAHLGGMIFGFILIKIWGKNSAGRYY